MRAFVDAKEFSKAISTVSKVIQASCIPALEQVSIRITGERCILSATTLNAWMTAEIPARGDDLAFVFRKTKDVIKACRFFEGDLSLEAAETERHGNRGIKVTMRCGRRSGEFEAYLPNEFPEIPEVQGSALLTTNAASLLERIERVSYATNASYNENRPLNRCIQFNGDQIYALDGFRAACDTDTVLSFPKPVAIPAVPLRHLKEFGKADVEYRQWKNWVCFTDGRISLYARIAGADLFDLPAALPRQFAEEFYVCPAEFLRELKYLKDFSNESKRPYVRFDRGQLFMEAGSGKYCTNIDLDGTSSIVFGFDLRWMADAISQFAKEDRVRMKVASHYQPIMIEAENRNDYAMVLPVRLRMEKAA